MPKSYPLTQIPQIPIIDFERERERERETGHESETDRQTKSVGYALNTCNKKEKRKWSTVQYITYFTKGEKSDCVYLYKYTDTHTYVHTYIHTYSLYTYIYIYPIYMYVYVYIYKYIDTYIRIYIYLYIAYIHVCVCLHI